MSKIDVTKCEFFDTCETDCGGTLEDTEMCSCYELYKQLTRKKQECETLSSQLDFEVQKKECLEQKCENLEAKNEDLKKEVKQIGSSFIKKVDLLNTALEVIDKLKAENKQAEQKLERIRNIAESRFCSCTDEYCDLQRKYGECKDSDPCNSYILRQILKIIEEVE